MNFELFYGTGGHSGPYQDMEIAVRTAVVLLRNSSSERSIAVHPRTTDGTGGYGKKVVRVFKHSEINGDTLLRFDPPQEWTVAEFMKRFEPETDKPQVFTFDRFVSAVRVELQTKVHVLQMELLNMRLVGTVASQERCDVIRGEIAGIQGAETVLIDTMRSKT